MLSSWKEIAHFFGKGVRTVQRWEKTLDLPIHRPPGAPSNVVLARTSDLEEWMHRGPVSRAVSEEAAAPAPIQAEILALADLEREVGYLLSVVGTHTPVFDTTLSAQDRISVIAEAVSRVNNILASSREARAA